ncbi:MAG: 4'-phosphopantetheinyl transferase superfamily protein [Clostridia bacterium]|nr:4'-phosphopantetheinyl transferase superfamily protein [Clostridia bacterium]
MNVSKLTFVANSKPVLLDECLHISFTHSNEYVGCAISNKPVGIDIEKVKPVKDSVISRVCSQDEILCIKAFSDFFKFWTLKESYIKATGDKFLSLKDINFASNNKLQKDYCTILTGEIDGYKWSIIEIV